MDDLSVAWVRDWLKQMQAVDVSPDILSEPARLVARMGALARVADSVLPFDIDPTGFTQRLDALAERKKDND